MEKVCMHEIVNGPRSNPIDDLVICDFLLLGDK